MAWPTWDSLAEQAINSLPTWEKVNNEAAMLIAFRQKVASVEGSGWALGKSQREIDSEALRRLKEGE